MAEESSSAFVTAMAALVRSERECRDQLLLARDRLADRDVSYAALEADHWAGWERHERNTQQQIADLQAEVQRLEAALAGYTDESQARNEALDVLRGEAVRLQVRLEGIVESAPYRLYARIQQLPVMRAVWRRRTRRYEERLASRR